MENYEIPIVDISHLVLIGGHTISTSAITILTRENIPITIFDSNGLPVTVTRPFKARYHEHIRTLQITSPPHKFAVFIAKNAISSRLLAIGKVIEELEEDFFYKGEVEIFQSSRTGLESMITMDEIRRLHRLSTDMYYEVMSRTISPRFQFRRRSERPHNDPVNSMLSLGYAILFAIVCSEIVGSDLDPDCGFLAKGEWGLVYDIMDLFRANMVDKPVFTLTREILSEDQYDCSGDRCNLNGEIIRILKESLKNSINRETINNFVINIIDVLQARDELRLKI